MSYWIIMYLYGGEMKKGRTDQKYNLQDFYIGCSISLTNGDYVTENQLVGLHKVSD